MDARSYDERMSERFYRFYRGADAGSKLPKELEELTSSEDQTDAHYGITTHDTTPVLFDFEGSPIAPGDPIVDTAYFLTNSTDRIAKHRDKVMRVIRQFGQRDELVPLSKFPKAEKLALGDEY